MVEHHVPVLLKETLALIDCRPGGIYVDATLGDGGHAFQLLESCPSIKMLVGIDCDRQAVERARTRLQPFAGKVVILQGNFRQLKDLLAEAAINEVDGVLFDLGVSTTQLKNPGRGFSFSAEGPVDMRMDTGVPRTANDLLASLSAPELAEVLKTYGEERWAKRIARQIKGRMNQPQPLTTTELARLVNDAIPGRYRSRKINPATRAFQALRIAVNDELGALSQGLDHAHDLLKKGGRLCVISFHSLEDRMVKNRFRQWSKGCTCPPGLPACVCSGATIFRVITRRPVCPSPAEVAANPRSRSARLRAGERI
jgi:16S rRNA (cytosine1402-N4)-methyltransferase